MIKEGILEIRRMERIRTWVNTIYLPSLKSSVLPLMVKGKITTLCDMVLNVYKENIKKAIILEMGGEVK